MVQAVSPLLSKVGGHPLKKSEAKLNDLTLTLLLTDDYRIRSTAKLACSAAQQRFYRDLYKSVIAGIT